MKLFKKFFLSLKAIKISRLAFESIAQLEEVKSLDQAIKFLDIKLSMNVSSLDLGCGDFPRNPFLATTIFGVDVRDNTALGIKKADLAIEKIPYDENSFHFVTAFDFIEHIPRVAYVPERRLPFVELMNEIYRVLKDDGIFMSQTPIYPFGTSFRDPTHVNFITDEVFSLYFDNQNRIASMYGFNGSFQVLGQYRMGTHLISFLKKDAKS